MRLARAVHSESSQWTDRRVLLQLAKLLIRHILRNEGHSHIRPLVSTVTMDAQPTLGAERPSVAVSA
jgi:hypothetical protein